MNYEQTIHSNLMHQSTAKSEQQKEEKKNKTECSDMPIPCGKCLSCRRESYRQSHTVFGKNQSKPTKGRS